MHVQGIMKGNFIELLHPIGIPDGMSIVMDISILPPAFQEQREIVDRLCGAWGNDPSLAEIFADIETERQRSQSREISFDLPS